jgi:hypothetical protein
MQDAGCRIRDGGYGSSRWRRQEAGNGKLEIRNSKEKEKRRNSGNARGREGRFQV